MKSGILQEKYSITTFQNTDLHSHTWRCKHATGEVIDYARKAERLGLSMLGASDHGPMQDGRWSNFRMEMDQAKGYFAAIAEAREAIGIPIAAGIEVEYVLGITESLLSNLSSEYDLDYALFGAHFFLSRGEWRNTYTDLQCESDALDYLKYLHGGVASGQFFAVAHPDLYTRFQLVPSSSIDAACTDLIDCMRQSDTLCELNLAEYRRNPRQSPYWRFWELVAERRVGVIVSSDAHRPEDVGFDEHGLPSEYVFQSLNLV